MDEYKNYPHDPGQLSRELSQATDFKTNLSELDYLLLHKRMRQENDRLLEKIEAMFRMSVRKIEETGTAHPLGNRKREFITTAEFAQKIGRSVSFVTHHCRIGSLAATKNGPRAGWMIHISELEKYIEAAELNQSRKKYRL